ncbi:MAG: DUF6962 family protein [Spirochaetia bacterium]
MVPFTEIATEQTTAITDLLLGLLALYVLRDVRRHGRHGDNKKTRIWSFAFGFLACAAFLGAVVHGLELSRELTFQLWQPIYLGLGLTVTMFLVGVVYDWRRFSIPAWLLPAAVVVAVAFYAFTLFGSGAFLVFVAYEGVVLVIALLCYLSLAIRRGFEGAGLMSIGILISIVAGGVQAAGPMEITLIVPFDHNGLFHLIQMPGLLFLMWGLRAELRSRVRIGGSVASSAVGPTSRV